MTEIIVDAMENCEDCRLKYYTLESTNFELSCKNKEQLLKVEMQPFFLFDSANKELIDMGQTNKLKQL